MNIQIFGTKKSFDTKKAQRYFKERRVKFQFIDLKEKGMSKGELESVARAVGGIEALINPKAKDQDTVALVQYLTADQRVEKLLDNQQIIAEPIVRNGRQATIGYQPDGIERARSGQWTRRAVPSSMNVSPQRRRDVIDHGVQRRDQSTLRLQEVRRAARR